MPDTDAPTPAAITSVLWDVGGVLLTSPFEAFAHYEAGRGLPHGFIRTVNTHNPDDNAWARLERSELSPQDFDAVFAEESAALGHRVPGADVLGLLEGALRPRMVAALHAVQAAGYRTACLTNNVLGEQRRPDVVAVLASFDLVLESSKVGLRKPQTAFYDLACAGLGVAPTECVFLDDLGINLKPAAAMGMRTIKVADPDQAIADLSSTLSLALP